MFYSYEITPTGDRQTEIILEDTGDTLAAIHGLELFGEEAAFLRDRLREQKATALLPEYDARRTSPYFIDDEAELIIEGLLKATTPNDNNKQETYVHGDRAAIARDILERAGIIESQTLADVIPMQEFRENRAELELQPEAI